MISGSFEAKVRSDQLATDKCDLEQLCAVHYASNSASLLLQCRLFAMQVASLVRCAVPSPLDTFGVRSTLVTASQRGVGHGLWSNIVRRERGVIKQS